MKKIIVLLGVLGVSLSAIFVKITDAPSMVLVFYRTLAAALMLLPAVCLRFRGEITRLTKKEVILCMISGIFLGLHFTAYFESLRYTSIAASVIRKYFLWHLPCCSFSGRRYPFMDGSVS